MNKNKTGLTNLINQLRKSSNPYLIKKIAANMYLSESPHLKILESFGKHPAKNTLAQKRALVKVIIRDFGNFDIRELSVHQIQIRLMNDTFHSSSWKNMYLSVFTEIYDYTTFVCPRQIQKPIFLTFVRNSKKCDIFYTDELNKLFLPENWDSKDMYLFFLLTFSCGLRLGECRGLLVRQLFFEQKILLVDGFCDRDGKRINHCKKGSEDNKKARIAPLTEKLISELKDYIWQNNKKADDFLFSIDQKAINAEHARRMFYKALKKSGIQTGNRKLVPHSLRFTYVTRMRRLLDLESTRKIAGHTSPEMTEYYTRSNLQDLIEGLSKKIFTASEQLFK